MDAKELYSQIEDIIGKALRPEIIRRYTVEEARVKCIALISSTLSAQAAEVERLRAAIKGILEDEDASVPLAIQRANWDMRIMACREALYLKEIKGDTLFCDRCGRKESAPYNPGDTCHEACGGHFAPTATEPAP